MEELRKEDGNNKFIHFNILKHQSLSKWPLGELIDLQTQKEKTRSKTKKRATMVIISKH